MIERWLKRFFYNRLKNKYGGAYHFNAYGPNGRYVVIVDETEYHILMHNRL